MLARVLTRRGDTLILSWPGGAGSRPAPTFDVQPGDLVRVDEARVIERLAINHSAQPLDHQDWWRLHRVLPNLRRRHEVVRSIRRWFDDQGFLEVSTPILARSPGLEVHLAAVDATACEQRRHLITSPEYHMKRLLSAGVERLYYLGPSFRDGEQGHQHNPEFTMLEWYRVGEGTDTLMADVAALVEQAAGPREWTRLTVAEALQRWGRPTEDPDDVIRQLVEHVEPRMAELGSVFLTDWPASLASLARLSPTDPSVSERFEAYVDGVELANGFGELTDAAEQRQRFDKDLAERRRLGLPEYPVDERFLDALASGLPPCAGIALGVDRLVMLATGAEHIGDVTAFPFDLA